MRSDSHYLFPPFRLDPVNAQLWKGVHELSLRPKTFEVLRYLVEHPGQLVTKAALLDAVWTDVSVSESMPAVCVKELRRALGDEARTPRFIETVHRRGYRFIAKITTAGIGQAKSKPKLSMKGPGAIMVGRNDELARAQEWYSQVLEGQRRVLFVAGEAGIGKSTFVQTFLDSIAHDGAVRLGRGQCIEQHGAGEPYMPVIEALNRLCHEPGGRGVIELLHKFAPTWLAQMPSLLEEVDIELLQTARQGVTQQRMLREMTQALEALASDAPLVMLLEDLHWSDFSTIELISAVARQSEPARLLVVGTYRPVAMLAHDHPLRAMKQELELHQYCEELQLKLLDEEDVASYLAQRFSNTGSRSLRGFAPVIHARTDGNPLFMVNVVDYLVDAGLLTGVRDMGTGSLETFRAERLGAPRNIRQMIERNLERLKPEEQAVLEGASVAGAEFSAASVAAALERPQYEVEACCTRLSRHEQFVTRQDPITWPDGTVAAGFRFHHALYQAVLYGRLPDGHRLVLHQRIAAREEMGYGERAGEVATELAHHYSLANVKNKAIQYFQLAAERAVARGAMVEAEDHYRCALKLLGELAQSIDRDRHELSLQVALGSVLWSSRSWAHPDASRAYSRALELAEKLGETSRLVIALNGLAGSANGNGHYKLGRELGERMLVAAKRGGERPVLCAAHTRLGETLMWCAQYAEAREHLEWGCSYYEDGDSSELGVMGLDAPALAAIVALLHGFPDQARRRMSEALRRTERRDDPFWAGFVHMWGGILGWLLRDARSTLDHALALRRLSAKQPVFTGLADLNTARALMFQGKWEEGGGYLRKAIAFHETVSLVAHLARTRLDEIEFFASQGQVDDGLSLVANAVADTEELAFIRSPALRQRASLLAQSNAAPPTVDAAYRDAIECARSQGAKYYELVAATHFARWLQTERRGAEAYTMLAAIYNWFTEGFDTVALTEGKALLDELNTTLNIPHLSNDSGKTH